MNNINYLELHKYAQTAKLQVQKILTLTYRHCDAKEFYLRMNLLIYYLKKLFIMKYIDL